MFASHFGKSVTDIGFLRFSPSSCLRRHYSGNLACRTNGVEDTHITLAAIPFYVEVNKASIFFAVTNIQG